jgi:hypothetical protein
VLAQDVVLRRGDRPAAEGMEEAYKTMWLEGVDFNDEATTGGTDISSASRTRLGLEAVQEFQVMATGYSAEFGRSGAGAVNVILKSGGNDVRGNAFYFLRDDAFDRPAFQLSNGIATPAPNVPPFRREQYGGTSGDRLSATKPSIAVSLPNSPFFLRQMMLRPTLDTHLVDVRAPDRLS